MANPASSITTVVGTLVTQIRSTALRKFKFKLRYGIALALERLPFKPGERAVGHNAIMTDVCRAIFLLRSNSPKYTIQRPSAERSLDRVFFESFEASVLSIGLILKLPSALCASTRLAMPSWNWENGTLDMCLSPAVSGVVLENLVRNWREKHLQACPGEDLVLSQSF